MVFEIKETKNKWIDEVYENSMKELDEFFSLRWKHHRPKIILFPNRETMDKLRGERTEDWFIAWAKNEREIYLLSPENFELESCHKFSKESYASTIKHELAHCFTRVVSKGGYMPCWLSEGISIYLAGQSRYPKHPKKLTTFLDYFDKFDKDIYQESGLALESLVKNHGKENLLNLLKKVDEVNSRETFEKLFESIYDFKLEYKNFPISYG